MSSSGLRRLPRAGTSFAGLTPRRLSPQHSGPGPTNRLPQPSATATLPRRSSRRWRVIHPTAEVEAGARLGANTRVWHFAHIRSGAQVGDGCIIGYGVYVDTG